MSTPGSPGPTQGFLVDYDAFAFDPGPPPSPHPALRPGSWRVARAVDQYFGDLEAVLRPPGRAELDSVFYVRGVSYRCLPLLKKTLRHSRSRSSLRKGDS